MLKRLLASLSMAGLLMTGVAAHAQEAPDALIQKVSTDVIEAVKADKGIQSGDAQKIFALVDTKVMPYVDFQRMTASAVGRFWRQATPDQQARLQTEFKTLLVRTYAGALTQVKDQSVQLKPMRSSPSDTEVVVRTEVRGGRGDPIQLDYRLEKAGDAWKIYDVNVLGVWLVAQYQSSFSQEIGTNGIDGLIKVLSDRNKAAAAAQGGKIEKKS